MMEHLHTLHLVSMFQIPLEKAAVSICHIQGEWDDMVDYAKRYFNLVQDNYCVTWWKLFNSVDAHKINGRTF